MNNKHVKIGFISGYGEGKTSVINALWPHLIKDSSVSVIKEEVKGRGEMTFEIKELSSIVFSLKEVWLSNDDNIHDLHEMDVLVFVLPTVTFGYDDEIAFISHLLDSHHIKTTTHVVFAVNKADSLCKEIDGCKYMSYESLSRIIELRNTLYNMSQTKLPSLSISLEEIVCCSAIDSWGIDLLKEAIWDKVIAEANVNAFNENVPTIVISGKRGCGKTTTLNKLFNMTLPTDVAVACTKYPMVIPIKVNGQECNLVDLPGIAESINADLAYAKYYNRYIAKADILFCLSQSDVRAYKQDEIFYKSLIHDHVLSSQTKLILGINQIDRLFVTKENPDGIDLNTVNIDNPIIQSKINDFYNVYSSIFENHGNMIDKSRIVAFSAVNNWNLDILYNTISNNLN